MQVFQIKGAGRSGNQSYEGYLSRDHQGVVSP
jgi:hypothetical protein